jgi:hypothetical protein
MIGSLMDLIEEYAAVYVAKDEACTHGVSFLKVTPEGIERLGPETILDPIAR